MFRQLMEVTLREDKEIVENIYPEYQRGFMNARYDKQVGTHSMGRLGRTCTSADALNRLRP